jgi:hypothetical protein
MAEGATTAKPEALQPRAEAEAEHRPPDAYYESTTEGVHSMPGCHEGSLTEGMG